MNILPFDEINNLKNELPLFFDEDGRMKQGKEDIDPLLDMLEDLFLLSYARGAVLTASDLEYTGAQPTAQDAESTVNREIQGKTWRQRILDYQQNGGTLDDVVRIVETESHRDANAGAYETAIKAGATTKTWRTMGDDRVRDTHWYLDGVSAPIDGVFYSYMGGETKFPGEWGIPEEDCNCRCWLTFK